MPAPAPARVYYATVERWIDGDTVVVWVDQGFDDQTREHLRLKDCWCPELKTSGGPAAWSAADALAPAGTRVVIESFHDRSESLGRYMANIWVRGQSIADYLISSGHGSRTRPAKVAE